MSPLCSTRETAHMSINSGSLFATKRSEFSQHIICMTQRLTDRNIHDTRALHPSAKPRSLVPNLHRNRRAATGTGEELALASLTIPGQKTVPWEGRVPRKNSSRKRTGEISTSHPINGAAIFRPVPRRRVISRIVTSLANE